LAGGFTGDSWHYNLVDAFPTIFQIGGANIELQFFESALVISNERPSPYGNRPPLLSRSPAPDEILKTGQVEIEHKTFVLTLRQNQRGRFLRINEQSVDKFCCVIVPAPGLEAFRLRLDRFVRAIKERGPAASREAAPDPEPDHAQIDRKSFVFALEQCPRGQVLRIKEMGVGGRSHELVILASRLEAFKHLVDEMARAAEELPPPAFAVTPTPGWRPPVDETLRTEQMQIGRRTFTFYLKKNPNGRYLRIVEVTGGRDSSLNIPVERLEEFIKWVVELAKAAKTPPG